MYKSLLLVGEVTDKYRYMNRQQWPRTLSSDRVQAGGLASRCVHQAQQGRGGGQRGEPGRGGVSRGACSQADPLPGPWGFSKRKLATGRRGAPGFSANGDAWNSPCSSLHTLPRQKGPPSHSRSRGREGRSPLHTHPGQGDPHFPTSAKELPAETPFGFPAAMQHAGGMGVYPALPPTQLCPWQVRISRKICGGGGGGQVMGGGVRTHTAPLPEKLIYRARAAGQAERGGGS